MALSEETIQEALREIMRRRGCVTSERKAASSRENGRRGGHAPWPLEKIPCTCGGEGLDHPTTCPRGRTIRRREKKKLKIVENNAKNA